MNNKLLVLIIIILITSSYLFQNEVSGISYDYTNQNENISYVGECGDYNNIQDAINSATDGDIIYVYPGVYHENLLINKKISIIGLDAENTIISCSNTTTGIKIDVDNVSISHFTINGSHFGINILANNSRINGNRFIRNFYAIWLDRSNNTIISNNTFVNNHYFSISMLYCTNVEIYNNTVISNSFGIAGIGCYNCVISYNNISNNELGGIDFLHSSYNQIKFNKISHNHIGVWLGESTDFIVFYNDITKNFIGIKNTCSSRNHIHYNNIYENIGYGFSSYYQIAEPRYNWWGDKTGPKKKNIKFIGTGDNVSSDLGFVFFRPYLKKPVDFSNSEKNNFYFTFLNKLDIFTKKVRNEVDNSKYINGYIFSKNIADTYDMVIITPKEYELFLNPLVQHKNNFGINTTIVTLSDIYRSYNGYDKAEEIKLFIKDSVKKWSVKFIMLVGGIDEIPIRKVWSSGNKPIISDLYYSDIYNDNGDFSSWDTNQNGFYGEFYHNGFTDEVDLTPDVCVGRLACTNIFEVKTVVNKIIRYETQKYDESNFKRVIYCAGDSIANFGDISEGEFLSNEIIKIMNDFEPVKLWMSNNRLSTRNITNEINKGAGFVFFSMHGGPTDLMTSSKDGRHFRYSVFDLLKLKNSDCLPIFYIDACLSAKLDFIIPSTAWSAVKKIAGGSIATIASTRVSMGYTDKNGYLRGSSKLAFNFFNSYKNSTYLSEMYMKSIKEYITEFGKDYTLIQEQILLGDPSLKIGGYL